MARGRKIPTVTMTAQERETLERWARRPTTAQAVAMRARVVLASVDGRSILDVAREEQISWATAKRWRSRFIRRRLDGLLDEPRPGAPRQVADADVERVLTLTLESTPRDATHWSTRAMARTSGLSQTTVACLRAAAASHGNLQTVEGPVVHREGPRHRWAVPATA